MIHNSTPLLILLENIQQAGFLETYFYFPHVILTGNKNVERADFEYLLTQSYIKEVGSDTFGKQYSLTSKAEQILFDSFCTPEKDAIVFAMN